MKLYSHETARLRVARLRVARLRVARLRVARLRVARLRVARLRVARLRVARLRVARLRVARLRVARLRVASTLYLAKSKVRPKNNYPGPALALAPRRGAVLDAREGMHVGVVQSRVECGNFQR